MRWHFGPEPVMFYGGEKGGVFLWLLVTGVKYKGKGVNLRNLRSKV